MKIMAIDLQRIVETSNGVYQPASHRLEAAVLAVGLIVGALCLALGWFAPVYALLYFLLLVVDGAIRVHQYRKFGPLGRPCVAVIEDTLVLARPGVARGALNCALCELERLVVYGVVGRRIYRLVHHDGTYIEVSPIWSRRVEGAVLEFLRRALPDIVTVHEPQTFFAYVRGDGP